MHSRKNNDNSIYGTTPFRSIATTLIELTAKICTEGLKICCITHTTNSTSFIKMEQLLVRNGSSYVVITQY